jgi:phospholipid-binding lipoprotein MlaA
MKPLWLRFSSVPGLLLALFMLSACASTGPGNPGNDANDPLEPFNRAMFSVNDVLDSAILRPVSYGYKEIIPAAIRELVHNFLRWLHSPVIFANDLLQGDFKAAEVTASRFLVNGVLLGFVELADGLGLPYRREDFGQTLGTYGAEEGAYIVLPILGPSSVRDVVGRIVDYFLDPFSYSSLIDSAQGLRLARQAAKPVDFRSRNFDQIDELKEESLDYYAKVRTIYRQRRQAQIMNGEPVVEESKPDVSEDLDKLFLDSEPESETGQTVKPTS